MTLQSKLALSLSFVLGFGCLALLFHGLKGPQPEVDAVLAIGCAVSVFALWLASSAKR